MSESPRWVLALALAVLFSLTCEEPASPLAVVPAEVLWAEPFGVRAVGPAIISGRVIVAQPGSVVALDRESGRHVWTVEVGLEELSAPRMTASEGVVYAGGSRLVAIRASDGVVLSEIPVPAEGALAADAERLYVLGGRSIVALDPRSGAVLWQVSVPRPFGRWTIKGSFVCVAGDTVLCYDAEDGRSLWSAGSQALSIVVDLDIGSGRTVALTSAGAIVAYDRRTGAIVWRRDLEPPVAGSAVVDNVVYACRGGAEALDPGRCVALRESNGSELWRLHTRGGTSAPLIREGAMIFIDRRAIHRVDLRTGRITHRIEPPRDGPFFLASLAYSDGVLFARLGSEMLAIRVP